ncbi:hypothetical protein MSPP1_003899 [Malassezia sp. CBS 17886]|nr:hypothetical protein MSPP1_003899 [Malassezia sp. CBS 17886]
MTAALDGGPPTLHAFTAASRSWGGHKAPPPTPPAPDATSEEIFRHHLTLELLKYGAQPNDALLNRLVQQHMPAGLREQGAPQQAATPSVAPAELHASGAAHAPADVPPREAESPVALDARMDVTASTLFNLDFEDDEPVPSGSTDALFAPPAYADDMAGMATENFMLAQPRPFVQDKSGGGGSMLSIDPLCLAQQAAVADNGSLAGDGCASLPAVKEELSEDAAALGERSDDETPDDGNAFTAFTPMRLDGARAPRRGDLRSSSPSETDYLRPSPSETDNLRPSMEEYNKLSSKEKRQLRNKISARNFRNRRKEYIHVLEDKVKERDVVIESLRDQLSSLRLQNGQLREQARHTQPRAPATVDVTKLLDALQRSASHGADGAEMQAPLLPNTRKDLAAAASRPSSPSAAFWGGAPPMAANATLVA